MLLNRHRGLTNLHNAATLLVVAVFFWLYAEFIINWFSDVVRLTREAQIMPYFLSVVVGLLFGWRQVVQEGPRLTRLGGGEAAALAGRQVAIVALVVFSLMFATQDRSISRLFLGTFLLFAWLGLTALHRVLPHRLAELFYGRGQKVPTLFVGRTAHLAGVEDWVRQRHHLGVQPIGYVTLDATGSTPPLGSWLGSLAELPALIEKFSVGQVIMMELPASDAQTRAVIEACQDRGCRLLLHHDIEERLGHPVVSTEEDGHHFFTLHEEPLEEPINRALKRLFDLVVSLPVVVLILPPLCLVVWLVQRVQSPGPLFHIRPRAGEQRTQFRMLKFRTMHVAPPDERAEVKQAQADDQRIFPFARWLRRHSLDEFPQFWNVFTGQMSIVGPRPVMPLLDAEFERQARAYRTKHLVKPGITGLAQSEGFRGEIKTPEQLQERIRLDLHYIAHWSFWLDVQVTAKTLWQVFFPPPSAY
ncbi:MAG: exopolysaccharide biosynthesis polyprenyl glycosylphosphotransferase [Opitutae bacterium]|nr:exopolysaccharide biosynthesis polyprenyl glycosylphosphotransferase [Opitutae bacterium]